MKTLLLIDASALVYRFFHALPPLTNGSGEPIQAIYGLSSVLIKILREQKPDYAAAALDRPEPTFRKEEFKEYKSHRPPAPEALISQLKKMPEVFEVFGIKKFDLAGFEADDLVGTLSERFKNEPDLKIIILSGDLDMLQLVEGEKIVCEIIKSGTNDTIIYDEKKVKERYGLGPEQLPEYKALIGDSSDNIPGITGIGPKTASELLKEFGSLNEIFENIGLVKSKTAQKLEGKKDEAELYLRLSTIKKDVPLTGFSLADLKLAALDKGKLTEYFRKSGFESLIRRLENNHGLS